MGASPLPAERAEAADDGGETAMLAPTAGRGAKVPRLLDAAPDECACRRTLRRVLLSLPVQEDSTWATMRPRVVSSRAYRDLLSCVCATNGHSRPVSALRVFLDLVAARSSAGLTRSEHNRKKRVKESSRRAAGRAATATTPASARVEPSQPPARPPAPADADAAAAAADATTAAAALFAEPAGRAAAATTPAMDAPVTSYPTASARFERPPPPADLAPAAAAPAPTRRWPPATDAQRAAERAAARAATTTTPASARVEHSQPPARPPAPAVADAAAAAAALSAVPAGRAAAATTPAIDASVISYPTASARVERPPPPAEPAPEAVLWFDALVASMPPSKPAALPKPTSAAASAMVTIRPRKK